jgi:hypothetical protein
MGWEPVAAALVLLYEYLAGEMRKQWAIVDRRRLGCGGSSPAVLRPKNRGRLEAQSPSRTSNQSSSPVF